MKEKRDLTTIEGRVVTKRATAENTSLHHADYSNRRQETMERIQYLIFRNQNLMKSMLKPFLVRYSNEIQQLNHILQLPTVIQRESNIGSASSDCRVWNTSYQSRGFVVHAGRRKTRCANDSGYRRDPLSADGHMDCPHFPLLEVSSWGRRSDSATHPSAHLLGGSHTLDVGARDTKKQQC